MQKKLRSAVIKLAQDHPEFRRELVAILQKTAMDFTKTEWESYKKKHPGAEAKNHNIRNDTAPKSSDPAQPKKDPHVSQARKKYQSIAKEKQGLEKELATVTEATQKTHANVLKKVKKAIGMNNAFLNQDEKLFFSSTGEVGLAYTIGGHRHKTLLGDDEKEKLQPLKKDLDRLKQKTKQIQELDNKIKNKSQEISDINGDLRDAMPKVVRGWMRDWQWGVPEIAKVHDFAHSKEARDAASIDDLAKKFQQGLPKDFDHMQLDPDELAEAVRAFQGK